MEKDIKDTTLFLSDDFVFYTLEGEGRFIGVPSVFMRMSMCNLTCIGFKSEDSPFGCDSYISWSKKNKMTFEQVGNFMEERGFITNLKNGALLKLTGGEPFIQQKNLLLFCDYLVSRFNFRKNVFGVSELRIDFETNGTLMPDESWAKDFGATFTTSPKLKSNGDPEDKRYKPGVLGYLARNGACFKFVVQSKDDIEEIILKYINHPDIRVTNKNIWLMPCCGSRKELLEKGPQVAEWCKEYGFNFSNRMHLQIWDLALRV